MGSAQSRRRDADGCGRDARAPGDCGIAFGLEIALGAIILQTVPIIAMLLRRFRHLVGLILMVGGVFALRMQPAVAQSTGVFREVYRGISGVAASLLPTNPPFPSPPPLPTAFPPF